MAVNDPTPEDNAQTSDDVADLPHVGRKRDPARDVAILEATIEVLAEVGFSGLTMDLVAAQAKAGKATLYRRWPSKAELVLDAVTRMKQSQVDLAQMPDTGTLRGDLLALFKPEAAEVSERKLRVMAGLASMLSHDATFAEAATAALVEPFANAHFALMNRAVERGEISATADIATLSQVIPSMAAYRALMQRKPFALDFLVTLVDGVVLPALGIVPP